MVLDMNKNFLLLICVSLLLISCSSSKKVNNGYVVVASESVYNDHEWKAVVDELQKMHDADVVTYSVSPNELLEALRKFKPRYVAFVEQPSNLDLNYVININQLSRVIEDDIYTDFLWGIITGYDAESALQLVENGREQFVIHTAVSTIKEIEEAKWFDAFAYIDDHQIGWAGKKDLPGDTVRKYIIERKVEIPDHRKGEFRRIRPNSPDLLGEFYDMYRDYSPDLLVTASHATEYNLEMPRSLGNVISEKGELYANFPTGKKKLVDNGNRKVYLPIGNCQIGNIDKNIESMAPAWIKSANLAAFVGYVVPTWYGRSGWGALKYWLTTPGKYTISEATFLNMQDMLHQLNGWNNDLLVKNFDHSDFRGSINAMLDDYSEHEQGFFYDRDVLVYYGDPAANIRLAEIEEELDYSVDIKQEKSQCVVTIKTDQNFDMKMMKGNNFKAEHVDDLPFSYFFPSRLNNPRLAANQDWNVAVNKDFLLIYDFDFKPNMEYKVYLDVD